MDERLKKVLEKIKDWWVKFDRKQKGILISAFSVVVIMILILAVVLNHKTFEILGVYEDTFTSSQVVELLSENGIEYRTSTDGKTVSVNESDLSTANILLGANNIESAAYSFDNVTSNSFTTTESDKLRKNQKYMESKMEQDLKNIKTITSASVNFHIPENTGTLLSTDEESYAAIYIETTSDFKDSTAEAIANMAAFILGSDSTDRISIMNFDGTLIYPKESSEDESGVLDVSNQLAFTNEVEELVTKKVREVVLGTGQFENVSVSTKLTIDFDEVTETVHDYQAAEGQNQGVLSHEDYYESDNVSTENSAAVPGTSSNGEGGTTYVTGDQNGNTNSSELQYSRDYLPKEVITQKQNAIGSIVKDDSTVSLSAYQYHIYKEEDVETQGLLDQMTWEEFKVANGERVKLEVDNDLYTLVAYAAGVPVDNVAITAYEEPIFTDAVVNKAVSSSDIIVIVLTVLILALLALVVWRTVAGEKKNAEEPEEEEELSVESMIQSEPEQVADIELETKSETRKMIEKFVDDNPEAAAVLLRNWLDEEWGI